jgi:hypothetical protein
MRPMRNFPMDNATKHVWIAAIRLRAGGGRFNEGKTDMPGRNGRIAEPARRLYKHHGRSEEKEGPTHEADRRVKAVVYNGPRDIVVKTVSDARLEKPTDVLVKITTTNKGWTKVVLKPADGALAH